MYTYWWVTDLGLQTVEVDDPARLQCLLQQTNNLTFTYVYVGYME